MRADRDQAAGLRVRGGAGRAGADPAPAPGCQPPLKQPERACYLTLTLDEPYPRLQVTAAAVPGALSAGPVGSRLRAQAAAAGVRGGVRAARGRPLRPVDDGSCLAGALGRCHAPCRGGPDLDRYMAAVDAVRRRLQGDRLVSPEPLIERRMRDLAGGRRFEEAAAVRDQLAAVRRVAATLGSAADGGLAGRRGGGARRG